jgi:hypothetical protein
VPMSSVYESNVFHGKTHPKAVACESPTWLTTSPQLRTIEILDVRMSFVTTKEGRRWLVLMGSVYETKTSHCKMQKMHPKAGLVTRLRC